MFSSFSGRKQPPRSPTFPVRADIAVQRIKTAGVDPEQTVVVFARIIWPDCAWGA